MKLRDRTFVRFSPETRRLVVDALDEAIRRRDDSHIGTEHLLIAAVERVGHRIASKLPPERLRSALDEYDRASLESIGFANVPELPPFRKRRGRPPFTDGAKATLESTLEIAGRFEHRYIEPLHVLLALSERPAQDTAVRMLSQSGVDVDSYRREIAGVLRAGNG